MANWKKVVGSGSNVSQLTNDAGYLTSVTAQNAFASASAGGVNLLADSANGLLTFASASGTGLLISASAANDTLTYSLASVPNTSLANSAITIAGNSTSLGGSITAATILSSTGVVSGSAQVAALLPAGTVSGSIQVVLEDADKTGFTGATSITTLGTVTTGDVSAILPSGLISASAFASTTQGTFDATINGVPTAVDLGLETTDSVTFADLTVTGDLVVDGTASFQNTQNLLVADRFVLFASGSVAAGDGGIVVQQGTQNVGEMLGYENSVNRWGFTSSFDASDSSFTAAAYVGTVQTGTGQTAASTAPIYGGASAGFGTIHVDTDDGEIWIYS